MTNKEAIVWLRALALYFERKAADSQEDAQIMAMQQNAKNARKIVDIVQRNIK